MAKIIVITHGNLADEIAHVADSIIGQKSDIFPLSFEFDSSAEELTQTIQKTIESFEENEEVLILTDLFGGTPSNVTIPLVQKGKIEVITGFNMAMLIFLLTQPEDRPLDELCIEAKKAALESIVIASDFLP